MVDLTLPDGTHESLETTIMEREHAALQYADSQAKGRAIRLGSMPARSTAIVRTFCHQKLDVEDYSYCFRLPMALVPPYMGNASKSLMDDPTLVGTVDP